MTDVELLRAALAYAERSSRPDTPGQLFRVVDAIMAILLTEKVTPMEVLFAAGYASGIILSHYPEVEEHWNRMVDLGKKADTKTWN